MLQSYVLFEANSNNSVSRKGGLYSKIKGFQTNSTVLPEGEGVTATFLGYVGGEILEALKIIHRVPSVEGATATFLGNLKLKGKCKKINRKNAPDELSQCNNKKKQGG